jgi:hypothetical protein
MTTLLGKILVLVNLVGAIVLLAWALGLYTNRVDWSKSPEKGDKPKGELLKREERIKQLAGALGTAEARYRSARTRLLSLEAQRPLNDKWYREQLAAVEFGAGGKTDVPVLAPALKDGRPIPDPKNFGLPTMQPVYERASPPPPGKPQPLLTTAWYTERLGVVHKETLGHQDRHQKAVEAASAATADIIGPKGLRQRIADEDGKLASVEAELKGLQPGLYNGIVATENLLVRQQQLEARLAELKKALAAAERP